MQVQIMQAGSRLPFHFHSSFKQRYSRLSRKKACQTTVIQSLSPNERFRVTISVACIDITSGMLLSESLWGVNKAGLAFAMWQTKATSIPYSMETVRDVLQLQRRLVLAKRVEQRPKCSSFRRPVCTSLATGQTGNARFQNDLEVRIHWLGRIGPVQA